MSLFIQVYVIKIISELELTDPSPDIQTLFDEFNEMFFDNSLPKCNLIWSTVEEMGPKTAGTAQACTDGHYEIK